MLIIILVLVLIFAIILNKRTNQATNNEDQSSESSKTLINDELNDKGLMLEMVGKGQYGQPGKAKLTPEKGGKTKIAIDLNEGTTSAQPVYLHDGNCENIGEPKTALVYAINGKSETIVEDNLQSIIDQGFIIVVHKRINNFNNPYSYASCAEIKLP